MPVQSKFNIDSAVQKIRQTLQTEKFPLVGAFVATQAKYMCPVGKYSDGRVGGRLRGSITWATVDNKSEVESPALDSDSVIKPNEELAVKIGTNVEYAPLIELGSPAHFIVPKNPGGVLVFQIGDKKVFAKYVAHPGNAPIAYLKPAIDLYKDEIIELLQL